MITMVLGGLWHGAAWGFVLWGAIHGGALVIEHVLRERMRWSPPGWLKLADRLPHRRAGVDPVPRARPRPRRRRSSRAWPTGARRRCGACPVVAVVAARHRAAAAARRSRWTRCACASSACIRPPSARAWRSSSCSSPRRSPARACHRSSTSSSDDRRPCPNTTPSSSTARPAAALRARDALVVRVRRRARCCSLVEGAVDPRRGRADGPGHRAHGRARRRPPRRLGSPTAAARRRRRPR